MKANIAQIERVIRIILGAILLSISFIYPLITTVTGKAIVSVIGIILVVTGLIKY